MIGVLVINEPEQCASFRKRLVLPPDAIENSKTARHFASYFAHQCKLRALRFAACGVTCGGQAHFE